MSHTTVSGTESQDAVSLLQGRSPAYSGAQMQVVFATPGTAAVTDERVKAQIGQVMSDLKVTDRS